ncbi:hypothetical protein TcasGA2_TC033246 [Tribolium castaneum]|uniref:Uncharacterized protein n=1 Tax=Tribolium castaneum TaxID=7070 RepID=A0A139WHR6_TRICA|nr:hypothetical protein TcasGA2_TC033246 [Tribolium castaneum]
MPKIITTISKCKTTTQGELQVQNEAFVFLLPHDFNYNFWRKSVFGSRRRRIANCGRI